ncbi:unnamed protein product [Linum tenue]|uniref:Uncharacterized protein n=1 Tax=Linum tenue TaxID=586396 RepID=A0AAV0GZ79_9ROSI|nr:unnamed protein product [Linum tenue]
MKCGRSPSWKHSLPTWPRTPLSLPDASPPPRPSPMSFRCGFCIVFFPGPHFHDLCFLLFIFFIR